MNRALVLTTTAAGLALAGCAATYESSVRDDLREVGRTLAPAGVVRAETPDGTEASYVAYAMAQSPELRASYERWRAATLRIEPARRLPDPMVTYGFYARPVQTRVGPQRHRLMVRQDIPWPTKLTAAADAQAIRARAAERRFEAQALAIRRRVAEAWWRLWTVRRVRAVEREQQEILQGLSETLRARLEIGQATLADVQQVDLMRTRLDDMIASLDEEEARAAAALRAAISAPRGMPMPTVEDVPPPALVGPDPEALADVVAEHPFLDSFSLMAQASEAQAAALEADRFPRFSLGVDWIETGPAVMSGVQGSGDDAVILNFGISVPIWQGAYDDAQRAAEADAAAERAEREAALNGALAELTQALAAIRDSRRRVALYRDTLLPQATTAFESVIGSYAAGRATVAATILAQRDLLEIAVAAARARADHGVAWAQLERVVGRPVPAAADREEGGDE